MNSLPHTKSIYSRIEWAIIVLTRRQWYGLVSQTVSAQLIFGIRISHLHTTAKEDPEQAIETTRLYYS